MAGLAARAGHAARERRHGARELRGRAPALRRSGPPLRSPGRKILGHHGRPRWRAAPLRGAVHLRRRTAPAVPRCRPGRTLAGAAVLPGTRAPKPRGGQRWYHLHERDNVRAGDVLHWTAASQNWNHMCAECHSTHVTKGYDAAADHHHHLVEISVGCEGCHGGGARHLDWTKARTPDPRRASTCASTSAGRHVDAAAQRHRAA